jgi:hypothetical protein
VTGVVFEISRAELHAKRSRVLAGATSRDLDAATLRRLLESAERDVYAETSEALGIDPLANLCAGDPWCGQPVHARSCAAHPNPIGLLAGPGRQLADDGPEPDDLTGCRSTADYRLSQAEDRYEQWLAS